MDRTNRCLNRELLESAALKNDDFGFWNECELWDAGKGCYVRDQYFFSAHRKRVLPFFFFFSVSLAIRRGNTRAKAFGNCAVVKHGS